MEHNPKSKVQVHNLLIIDESGSMSPLREATMSGVNEVLDTIRQAQRDYSESQDHYVTIVTFNSHGGDPVHTLFDDAPIARAAFAEYNPGGGTPLYDAVGISLTRLEKRMAADEMATAVVTIVTDGMENSSREYTLAQVKALIERLTKQGWTFSYMGACHDVKRTATTLAITNAMEFAHDVRGTQSSWSRERGSKMAHYRRMNSEIDELRGFSASERAERWFNYNSNYYTGRVTPHMVSQLAPGEVFVFGSNIHGNHNGGAAGYALHHFGAVMGQAEGAQGSAYAIPTTDGVHPLPPNFVEQAVRRFIRHAEANPDTRFLVTAVGCGNAGLTPTQVAPMFRDAVSLNNVALPAEFWQILGVTL
ncbi:MAG: VWA domain-containing protein [Muribaculaceae bacterium]|nr:VWA domain-containing protein [Muribaculaceae bacterium]